MYKLLIVDDEQIVIDSVKYIVQNYMHNSMMVETARSGREAIEKAENYRPDIVITDIKMPGISGLDAISEIKKFHAGALFIIITAFANFDYAKEALKLGAIEYISKPLSRTKLITALENAIKIKEKERGKLKTELDFKEKMAFILPALENSFIYSVVLSDDHTVEMESLKKMLDLSTEAGYIITIELGDGKNADGPANKIGSSIKSQKVYPLLRDTIKEARKCIVGPVMINRIIVYVPCEAGGDEYKQQLEALEAGNEIYERLKCLDADVDFFIGIGKSYSSLREIYRSYEESLKAIDYIQESGVIHFNDIPVERGIKPVYTHDIEKDMLKKITSGETEAALLSFEAVFSGFKKRWGENLSELKSGLLELVVLIIGVSKDYNLEGVREENSGYVAEFMAMDDLKQIKLWLKDIVRRVSDKMADMRSNNLSYIVKNAVDYITENYSKNITLEDVSEAVNISPTYFSKLFKEETGKNFIDYLTSLRMNQAKILIEQGRCGNKEICDLVGYSDPNYFSRVFRKIVGVTPTEYRASLSGRSE